MYQGNSIVDYLTSTGQKSDFASRTQLAASKGINDYTGTAEQNTRLLNMLKTPTVQPIAQTPAVQPTQNTAPQSSGVSTTPSGGGFDTNTLVQALVSKGYNQIDAENAAKGPRAADLAREYLGAGGQTASGLGGGFLNTPSINLPELYNQMFSSSGISEVEKQIAEKSKGYNEAVAKIKDNPYLSEATMTGRLRKLDEKYNADVASLKNEVSTKKADIETALNIQTKQFDINSEQARNALAQFGSLLDSGALNNASGEDIAAITRATGLSSNAIQSAIQAKKVSGYSSEVKSFDDGANEGFIIYTIDNMGNVINQSKQITGKSSKSNVGQYSADPAVSNFIQKFVNNSSDISSLWNNLY